jgi:hypothetical protein
MSQSNEQELFLKKISFAQAFTHGDLILQEEDFYLKHAASGFK